MNIFATDPDPLVAARHLDQARLNKMTLESCQLLSTALHLSGSSNSALLKPTHAQHPVAVWCRESRENLEWLWAYVEALDRERLRRGSAAPHKSLVQLKTGKVWRDFVLLPETGLTVHVNAARNKQVGLDFTWIPDVYAAYRTYIRARWAIQIERAAHSRQKAVVCNVKTCR